MSGFLTPDDLSAIAKRGLDRERARLQVEDTITTPLETRWDLMLITPGQPALARDLLADLPECDPVPLPTAEDALAALARFEADRPRLLVSPTDQDRVQAALDAAPLDSIASVVKLETSDLVPEGTAYLINTQAINEAIERHAPWPTDAAVRWSE